jgi:hypothetical protein
MTDNNIKNMIKEAQTSINAVEQLANIRDYLKKDSVTRVIIERNYDSQEAVTINDKAQQVLIIMLDEFVNRYTEKFNELGIEMDLSKEREEITGCKANATWDEM